MNHLESWGIAGSLKATWHQRWVFRQETWWKPPVIPIINVATMFNEHLSHWWALSTSSHSSTCQRWKHLSGHHVQENASGRYQVGRLKKYPLNPSSPLHIFVKLASHIFVDPQIAPENYNKTNNCCIWILFQLILITTPLIKSVNS